MDEQDAPHLTQTRNGSIQETEAGSDRVREAKAHLDLNPVRAVKSSKKGFHRYISSKKCLLLNGVLVVYPRS